MNDAFGNLTNITYPVTPAISMAYDVLDRLTNMVDAVGTTRYSYDAASQLLSEDGPWADDTVSFTYANRLRTGLSLQAPNASPWTEAYGYDSARRLTNVTSQAGAFGYSYSSGRQGLVSRLLLPNTAYITNTYDGNARLLSTRLLNPSGGLINSHLYGYNQGNQRTQQVFTASDYVNYTYDPAGQLKTAFGKEAGGVTNRLHEQFGYSYDAAGNLNWKTNNALLENFNVNALNELTTESNSGTLTAAGTTTSAATNVTVNGLNAALYTDATFAKDGFNFTNGLNTFTAIGKDTLGRVSSNTVSCTLTNGSFSYDLNGNLLSDGTRSFAYDDENELTSVWLTNAWRSDFVYDGKMRRRIRREYTWSSGAWLQTNEVHYIYNGNLAVQERDVNNFPQVSYTRGRDLSGGFGGAGGVGSLLGRSDNRLLAVADSNTHAYYHADGNGNITCLINAYGVPVAKYLYDPFGNTASQSGALADANTYRFSSKEFHPSSGLICYEYRFYDPVPQRWLSRDPLKEIGGANLYGFLHNAPVEFVDPLGLQSWMGPGYGSLPTPGLHSPPPSKSGYNGSVDMFFSYWTGLGKDGPLSSQMLNDIINSSVVKGFTSGASSKLRTSEMRCGASGTFAGGWDYLPDFAPSFDFSMSDAQYWDWTLSGNWQLYMSASCSWTCAACKSGDKKCACTVNCTTKGNISKLYTFTYVGGNPINLITTLDSVNGIARSFIISSDFAITTSSTVSICCKK